jgi:hypothetical protein
VGRADQWPMTLTSSALADAIGNEKAADPPARPLTRRWRGAFSDIMMLAGRRALVGRARYETPGGADPASVGFASSAMMASPGTLPTDSGMIFSHRTLVPIVKRSPESMTNEEI